MMFDEEVQIVNKELKKLQFGMVVTKSSLITEDEFQGMLTYKIRGYVWSQDAGKKVEFKYPADWVEAFKERWFPKWLLVKYPVRYTVKTFEVKATYPDLTIQNYEPVLRMLEYTRVRN